MENLREILESFERLSEPFAEHDVQRAIANHRKQLEEAGEKIPSEIIAESMAFGFMEDYQNKDTGWGTYYGPFAVFQKDGQWVESPSIKLIDKAMLEYWSGRARDSKNPILKCRYAGLVWEFSQPVADLKPSPEMARIAIDASIAISSKKLHKFEVDIIKKLKRVLSLALSLNDSDRVISVRDAVIAYEDAICDDHKRGLFGFAHDLLIEENKNVPITDTIEKKIIGDLEARLERVSDPSDKSDFDPFSAESIALRLAGYYRKRDQADEVKRVLSSYGNAFVTLSKDAAGMVASAWLQKVHSVYLDFGMADEAEQIAALLPELGKKTLEEMKSITHEVTIPKKEMDRYIAAMTEGNLEVVFNRLAIQYIPSQEETEDQVKELSKKYVFQAIVPKAICDEKGQTVVHIGNIAEDLEGNVAHQMSQDIGFSALFLRQVLGEVRSKFNPTVQRICTELYKSPVFSEDKRAIIEAGLKAYLAEDYVVAIHLLIPQIEDAFRNIVEKMGGPIYKRNRFGGVYLKTLDGVLRDEQIPMALGEDASLYFRVLLTDPRGWNIRNSVCHGVPSSETFNCQVADRVFHALLVLAQLRIKNTDDTQEDLNLKKGDGASDR